MVDLIRIFIPLSISCTVILAGHPIPEPEVIIKEERYPQPEPYPVPVYKNIKVPVPEPYPVIRIRNIKRPVKIPVPEPYPVVERVPVRVPVHIKIPAPYPEPYPVVENVPAPYPVKVHIKVPVPEPYPVKVPVIQKKYIPFPEPYVEPVPYKARPMRRRRHRNRKRKHIPLGEPEPEAEFGGQLQLHGGRKRLRQRFSIGKRGGKGGGLGHEPDLGGFKGGPIYSNEEYGFGGKMDGYAADGSYDYNDMGPFAHDQFGPMELKGMDGLHVGGKTEVIGPLADGEEGPPFGGEQWLPDELGNADCCDGDEDGQIEDSNDGDTEYNGMNKKTKSS